MLLWIYPLCPVGHNSLPRAPQVSAVWGDAPHNSSGVDPYPRWYLMSVTSFNDYTRINKGGNLTNLFHLGEISVFKKKNHYLFSISKKLPHWLPWQLDQFMFLLLMAQLGLLLCDLTARLIWHSHIFLDIDMKDSKSTCYRTQNINHYTFPIGIHQPECQQRNKYTMEFFQPQRRIKLYLLQENGCK